MSPVMLNDFLPLSELALTSEQASVRVAGVSVDTRHLHAGEAFFALNGHQFDGRPFVDNAVAIGASVIFVEGCVHKAYWVEKSLMIEWPNLLQRASGLVGAYFDALGKKTAGKAVRKSATGSDLSFESVMAVTGTNGKTTCSHLYAQLWHLLGKRSATIGTLGSGLVSTNATAEALVPTGFTTPDAITMQSEIYRLKQQGAQVLSLEASSHSLHQYRMAAVPVTVAVFTNLTRDHLDYHGTMEDYAESKARLFRYPQVKSVVINWDDEQGRRWRDHKRNASEAVALESSNEANWYAYSLQEDNSVKADVFVTDVIYQANGIQATLITPWGVGELKTSLIGHFNLSNLLAVITAALAEGAEFNALLMAIPRLKAVKGRMELLDVFASPCAENPASSVTSLPSVVIDYAHTPDALEQALIVMQQHASGNIWCVFGCGGDRDGGKRSLMGEVAARLATFVVVTNDNPRSESPTAIADAIIAGVSPSSPVEKANTHKGVPNQVHVELDRAKAIKWVLTHANEDDWVLIAGKGHEDYQIIGGQRLPFSDHKEALAVMKSIHSISLAGRGKKLT